MIDEDPAEDGFPEGLAQRLDGWEQEDSKHWANWRTRAKESFAFVSSDQWSREERSQAEDAGRLVTTINRIGPMINAVAGAEIIDRQQVQYIPRTTGDAAVNEILTMGAEWIRDQTMADREESDAFRDTLICGLGYTETVMNYDDEPEGKVVIQRIDPVEVTPDAAARKANLLDARRLSRKRRMGKDEFEQTWPDATAEQDKGNLPRVSGNRRKPSTAYKSDSYGDDDPIADDEVVVTEWQWFEFEAVHVVVDPQGQYAELTEEQFAEGLEIGAVSEDESTRQRRKRYFRAMKCGAQILEYEPLPDGEFTIKAITGERNRNKGWFDGIVESMKDPQRFANLFFSMLHHIIRTNAKGGIMAETDAFADPKKAQESWSRADAITWMKPGSLGKVRDKPSPDIPPQITQLLQFSVTGIRDASGINEELLGLVGRDQAGVLEHQRKEAAYAILAHYYDSLRFYRKSQGGLLLKYMQKYLPEDYLVRIIGEDGNPQYVPLAKQPETVKFDVIVDDAPAGPNEKERVWSLITNAQAIMAQAGPEIWAEIIDYSPFPDKVNKSLKQVFQNAAQPELPDPMTAQKQQSEIQRDQAGAAKDAATAEHTQVETALLMSAPRIPLQPAV
jgi:hypothetical protein